jgi:hypothetical protein
LRSSVRIVLVLVLAATAAVATGCEAIIGEAVKSGVESATGVKVDDSNNSVTLTGTDGSTVSMGGEGTLPEGFPADVPVYEGTIKKGIATSTAGGKGFVVIVETPDAPADVLKWYEGELEAGGWTTTSALKAVDGGRLAAEKDATAVTVTIGPGTKTNVALSVTPRKK